MPTYAKVKRIPGKTAEVTFSTYAPKDWDDSEERELEWLARGAGELARRSLAGIDKNKAQECRKKMLHEMKQTT